MTKNIPAIPSYRFGVEFRSRLEARWAVFLEYHWLVNCWVYEPKTFHHPKKNWNYTPDFLVKVGPYSYFLEIKPTEISASYLSILEAFLPHLPYPLLLCCGSFFKNIPTVKNLLHNLPEEPLDKSTIFVDSDKAIKEASFSRFDIEDCTPLAPFRQGTTGMVEHYMLEWAAKEKQKRKPANHPKYVKRLVDRDNSNRMKNGQ